MSYSIRPAREEDISQLSEVEKEAFPTTWPPTPFKRELSNTIASFLVAYPVKVECQDRPSNISGFPHANVEPTTHKLKQLWRRLTRRLPYVPTQTNVESHIAGYVASWYMTDEAHITGIAVRQSLRGNGLGELLLIGSIKLALQRQSRVVTLEVRVSNYVAQSLYTKYGFSQVGLRRGYYTDNHEDAYIMTTEAITSFEYGQQLHALVETYKARHGNQI